jgi:hypothetical protein
MASLPSLLKLPLDLERGTLDISFFYLYTQTNKRAFFVVVVKFLYIQIVLGGLGFAIDKFSFKLGG